MLPPFGKVYRLSFTALFIIALIYPHRTDGAAIGRIEDEDIRNGSSARSMDSAVAGEGIFREASELELGTDATDETQRRQQHQRPSERRQDERAAADRNSETTRAIAGRSERQYQHQHAAAAAAAADHHHISRSGPTETAAELLGSRTRTPSQLHHGASHRVHRTRHAVEKQLEPETPLNSSSGRHSRQRSRSDRDLHRAAARELQQTAVPLRSGSVPEVTTRAATRVESGETIDHQPPFEDHENEEQVDESTDDSLDDSDSEALRRGRRCVVFADGSGRVRMGGRAKVARWTPSSPHYVLSMGKRHATSAAGARSRSDAVTSEGQSAPAMTHVCTCHNGLWEDDDFDVCRCWSPLEEHNASTPQHVLLLEGGATSGRLQCSCTQESALRVCACGGPCVSAREDDGDSDGDGAKRLCLELHEVRTPPHHSRFKRDRTLIDALRRRHKPSGTHRRHAPSLYLQSLLNGALG